MGRVTFCLVFALSLLMPALRAEAVESWHTGKITKIYPLANGSVVFTLDTDAPACTSTSRPKYLYLQTGQNGMTADGVKNILSSSLAAAAQGRQISVAFDDATTSCFINRVIVNF